MTGFKLDLFLMTMRELYNLYFSNEEPCLSSCLTICITYEVPTVLLFALLQSPVESSSSLVPEDLSSLPLLLPRTVKGLHGEDGQREVTGPPSRFTPFCSFLKARKITKVANSVAIRPGC